MHSPYMKGLTTRKSEQTFPASPTLIQNTTIDEQLKYNYMMKRTALLAQKNNKDIPIYDKRLRPYQNNDVHYLTHFSQGKAVFNQQRLGKTPITLVTMRVKKQNRNLILVPKSTVGQWYEEYKKWHGGEVTTLKDWWPKSKRIEAYQNAKGTIIVNYDKAKVDYNALSNLGSYDAIVIDEAHVLRNYVGHTYGSRTPQLVYYIMQLRKKAADVYALTGTPTPNKEHDICGILAFLYPDLFQYYWNTIDYYFKQRQETNYSTNKTYPVIDGFINEFRKQELLEFIELFSVQRKRKDVMKWLPKVDHRTLYLEPTKEQRRNHEEIKHYMETDGVICENHLTAMIAMRQITTAPEVLGLNEKNPKFEWILDYISDYPKKPIIIVSSFTKALKALSDKMNTQKIKHQLMYGDTTTAHREQMRKQFQNGNNNVLLANINVAKEGLTLSRGEAIIFLDPSLTYTDNEQMSDRFLPVTPEEAENKEGQEIIKLVLKKTIDIYVAQSLNKKKSKTDIVNDYINHLRKEELAK